MTSPALQRETFISSRLLEYFSAVELEMQIGHEQELWPIALIKELIDNGLDACERFDIAPEILVVIHDDEVVVEDNGPGLPAEIVERSLDFSVRVSTNSKYVSPTRGQLGNALKTIWGAAFVVGDGQGHVEIDTPGLRHVVDIQVDALSQEPTIRREQQPSERKSGTSVRIYWPWVASLLDDAEADDSSRGLECLIDRYAAFNPHAAFYLYRLGAVLYRPEDGAEPACRLPTAPDWMKWKPSSPTSPHWYTVPQLADLIGAYVYLDRERGGQFRRSVRDFIKEFRGLTSTARLKSVTEAAGLRGTALADLCSTDGVDPDAARRLLAAMQAESRAVEAKHLGIIGRETLRARLVKSYGVAEASFTYEKIERVLTGSRLAGTTIPVVLEVAFAVRKSGEDNDGGRQVLTGVNWTPTIGDGTFPSLIAALTRANVTDDDQVVVVVHLATPAVAFTDRGKHRLSVDVHTVLDPAVEKVARTWTKAKRQRTKIQQAELKQLTEAKPKSITIKEACFQVMEQAYLKASANGALPAKGRQIMYAARPLVMALTDGGFYKSSSQTFQQSTLIDFMEDNPDVVADWQLVWDARGHFAEPHDGQDVDLGTLDVRAYIRNWPDGQVPPLAGLDLSGEPLFRGSGPAGRYGAVLFVEKEGFDELFDRVELRDRYTLAIMSTKGMSTTASRELIDAVAGLDIPIFILHDFDKAGMSIASTLTTTSRRYTFKNVPRVIDLGLRLDDVHTLDLEDLSEPVEYTSNKHPGENLAESGATVAERQFLVSGGQPGAWTGRRVELNAMTSDQLVTWLERKLTQHGVKKVVPDRVVLDEAYRHAVRLERLTARMLPLIDEIGGEAIDAPADLADRVSASLTGTATAWTEAVREIARRSAS